MAKGFGIIYLWAAGALALGGCAGNADRYPSLAIRDAERAAGTFTPAEPTEPAPTYTVDRSEIGNAIQRARASHEQFLAQRDSSSGIIRSAAGRGPESDLRSRALVALADLTTLRSATAIALADLDRLEVESATVFGPTEDIRTAQEYVARLVGEQDAEINSLASVMGL